MEESIPSISEPKTKIESLLERSLIFLSWFSPFIGLGIFFPIGVLLLYNHKRRIREAAFQSLFFQIFVIIVCFPVDILAIFNETTENFIFELRTVNLVYLVLFWAIFGLFILIYEARFQKKKYGSVNFFKEKSSSKESSLLSNSVLLVIIWLISIFWYLLLSALFLSIQFGSSLFGEEAQKLNLFEQIFKGENSLLLWLMTIYSSTAMLGRKSVLGILYPFFVSQYKQFKLSTRVIKDYNSDAYFKKAKYAKIRELIFPGWGHIYLQRNWKGFSILFIYLLGVFFFVTSVAFYLDPILGIKFLTMFGLKIGIPDKEFFKYIDSILYPISIGIILVLFYITSYLSLLNSLKEEKEEFKERGLRPGFLNNIYLSILAHLILFAVIMIIPLSIQRSSSKKKQDISKQHFTPEKMEFYFIDPEIPDQVKDLNGGVVAGTETPSKNDGMKIPDKKIEDEGKVKGYVKRIKGKKLPRTYSNYISARMRGPENFMNYWKRAPQPYSCVVAYTITTEGEVEDVILVEGSIYPDQDNLTLELIRSLSPLMPPPGVKGNVRVTELFWNGSLDPAQMPTELQKEMVSHFDGRYMEEEP
jgi:hypothetical protein